MLQVCKSHEILVLLQGRSGLIISFIFITGLTNHLYTHYTVKVVNTYAVLRDNFGKGGRTDFNNTLTAL